LVLQNPPNNGTFAETMNQNSAEMNIEKCNERANETGILEQLVNFELDWQA
jgi:hypothetical protein